MKKDISLEVINLHDAVAVLRRNPFIDPHIQKADYKKRKTRRVKKRVKQLEIPGIKGE